MKLKCSVHDRRVHMFDGKMMHRDSTPCDSKTSMIGGRVYHVNEVKDGKFIPVSV